MADEKSIRRQSVYNTIHRLHQCKVKILSAEMGGEIPEKEIKSYVKELKDKGLIYHPRPGTIACVKD